MSATSSTECLMWRQGRAVCDFRNTHRQNGLSVHGRAHCATVGTGIAIFLKRDNTLVTPEGKP